MEAENERNLLQQADRVASLSECFTWLQQCDECIKQLEERSRAKRPWLTVGHRQSLVARIARLEGAKTRLQRRFMPSYGDRNVNKTAFDLFFNIVGFISRQFSLQLHYIYIINIM